MVKKVLEKYLYFLIIIIITIINNGLFCLPISNKLYMGNEIVNDTTLPWMVTIQMKHNYSKLNINSQVFCTGTIIDEKYILTAAHCFQGWTKNEILSNPSASLVIGFGSTNFKNQTLIEFNNKMIKIHPKNKKTNNSIFGTILFADLALIELPESSKLNLFSSQKVRPIKLTNRLPLIKTKAIAAGWGWTKPFCEVNASINGKTNQLHFGWVDLMENNLYCINEMEVSFIQQFNKTFGLNIPPCISSWIRKISENNWLDKLCVRPNPASIQYGDSGGPLLVDFVDSWYQIGVVTQGMCNKDKKYISNQNYATFTYIDCEWIKMETNGKTLCF